MLSYLVAPNSEPLRVMRLHVSASVLSYIRQALGLLLFSITDISAPNKETFFLAWVGLFAEWAAEKSKHPQARGARVLKVVKTRAVMCRRYSQTEEILIEQEKEFETCRCWQTFRPGWHIAEEHVWAGMSPLCGFYINQENLYTGIFQKILLV